MLLVVILVILVLSLASAGFWSLFEQAGSTLNLFADEKTRNVVFGMEYPSSWFQSVNSIWLIALAALLLGAALLSLPVIGSHPVEPGLAMFNGLGSKGSLLAPKMAAMLAGHLLSGDAIPRDIDVRRRMAGERP